VRKYDYQQNEQQYIPRAILFLETEGDGLSPIRERTENNVRKQRTR
jgi:hypothetical protein